MTDAGSGRRGFGSGINDELQDTVDTQVGRKVPGLAVVVVADDGVVLSRAWGLADLAAGAEMSLDTTCNWFSMTKPATATTVVKLAERGSLDLDDPVHLHYPPFAITRPEARQQAVTIRHLLSHSSGLANPLPLRWVHLASEPGRDRARFVQELLEKHDRLRFEPGADVAYSNLGYLVLGEVVEAVTGQRFEEFVQQSLLEPLGMRRTGFSADPESRWATPYQRRRTGLNAVLPVLLPRKILGTNVGRFRSLNHFYLDGASYGGLVGPVAEAARFLQAHLRDGELDGSRVLASSSAQAMRTIHASGKDFAVGLGWYRRGRGASGDYLEHLGGGAGFWNCMRLHPGERRGVVMMGNATSYDHDSIARAALRSS